MKQRGKVRIVNGETGKETERTSRDIEGWGKEGTDKKGKVPRRIDSKHQKNIQRSKARQSFPKSQSCSLHLNKSLYYKAHTMDCPLHSVTSSV